MSMGTTGMNGTAPAALIGWDDFLRVELRVGQIVQWIFMLVSLAMVRDMPGNAQAVAIARAIAALAHSLGLQVVAEGVETWAQRQALAALGCSLFQGYYYSRPLPLPELLAWQVPPPPDSAPSAP